MARRSIYTVAVVAVVLVGALGFSSATGDSLNTVVDEMVKDSLGKILQGASTASSAFGTLVQPIGALGNQIINDYKAMGQTVMGAGATLGKQWLDSITSSTSHLGAFTDSITSIANAYEDQFCSPPQFIPAQKQRASFVGPSFNITLDSGSCVLNEQALYYDHRKELNCMQPSVKFSKIPAELTSKHISAPKFISKDCKISKEFGVSDIKVLYVFDGSPVDMASLTNQVMNEVRSALGLVTNGAQNIVATQLDKFMSTMSSLPGTGNAFSFAP